ncbi:hypothetical protein JAAARDRAFT_687188 [Jaapia argillacea MUCL 33604]|uniref:NADH:flavin oxidoreductase/NADH oxidase N-terminal domain-containing protein n=1 Tax=Jaapia argillacea MUCL 33604 TaxID=933084 RepID=A0A067Q4W0_9AGAM|nr:hypothetical protein JAAARDRAFT_687188 [Jaapia argillacea MUCL 33604]
MTERLCTWDPHNRGECGMPTDAYINLYKRWGEGEIGAIILGNIPVHRDHLEAPGNPVIDKNNTWDAVAAFSLAVAGAKAHGMLCIGQLTHPGRQSPDIVCQQPVSASETKTPDGIMGLNFKPARALTEDEIMDVIDRWAFAAEVLYKAGADGAQLHAAHGYLLSQFLSPLVNKRTDKWGGSFENRSRLIFEIIKAIRTRVPDDKFIISIKINSQDFIDGGFSSEECAVMVEKLEAAKVDLIELSGGTYESLTLAFEHQKESTRRREGFFVEFADKIRPHITKSILCVTGGFRNAEPMADAILQNTCGIIGLARPLCAEPDLPAKMLSGKSHGANVNVLDSPLQTPAAILQIHAIAESRPIPDLSKKDVADDVTAQITGKKKPYHPASAEYPPM